MRDTLHIVDTLFKHSLFTVLGIAIFLSGCSDYVHTQRYTFESETESDTSHIQLRENIEFNWSAPPNKKAYTGAQNASELMQALNADYNRGHSKTEVSIYRKAAGIETLNYVSIYTEREIDARYAREEWLQRLLDKGAIIENLGDYSRYLSKRHTLALLEDNPNLRQSGIFDIPPTADWETYKAIYMDRLVNTRIEVIGTTEQSYRRENGPFSTSVTITEGIRTGKSGNYSRSRSHN